MLLLVSLHRAHSPCSLPAHLLHLSGPTHSAHLYLIGDSVTALMRGEGTCGPWKMPGGPALGSEGSNLSCNFEGHPGLQIFFSVRWGEAGRPWHSSRIPAGSRPVFFFFSSLFPVSSSHHSPVFVPTEQLAARKAGWK